MKVISVCSDVQLMIELALKEIGQSVDCMSIDCQTKDFDPSKIEDEVGLVSVHLEAQISDSGKVVYVANCNLNLFDETGTIMLFDLADGDNQTRPPIFFAYYNGQVESVSDPASSQSFDSVFQEQGSMIYQKDEPAGCRQACGCC